MQDTLERCSAIPSPRVDDFPDPFATTVTKMNMGGSPEFTCDSIAQTSGPERRWHSYPGGRLCLNPASHRTFVIEPTSPDLSLDIGGYGSFVRIRSIKVCYP